MKDDIATTCFMFSPSFLPRVSKLNKFVVVCVGDPHDAVGVALHDAEG